MKSKIILILIIFFTVPVFAEKIGISPSQIEFKGVVNEHVCKNITIFGTGDFIGEDRWSIVGSKELDNYLLDKTYFDIEISYPKNLTVKERETFEVCVAAKNEGKFFGAIIYNHNSAGVGSWIKIETKSAGILTGSAIGSFSSKKSFFIIEVLLVIFLFLILIFLLKNSFLKKARLYLYGKKT